MNLVLGRKLAATLPIALMINTPLNAATYSNLSNVDVNGTLYNVTFHANESFVSLFDSNADFTFSGAGDRMPTFWGNKDNASAAHTAVAAILGVDDQPSTTITGSDGVMIPYEAVSSTSVVIWADFSAMDSDATLGDAVLTAKTMGIGGEQPAYTYPTFELATVPIPPSLLLLSPALFGLFGYSRYKKGQNLVNHSNTNAASV